MQYLVGNRPALTKSTKKICRSLNLDSLIQVEPHRWMLNAHLIEITKLASAGSPLLHTRLPIYKKRIETFASRKSIDAGWMNQIPELYVTEFASPGTWLEMANGWPDEGREVTHWPREIQSSGAIKWTSIWEKVKSNREWSDYHQQKRQSRLVSSRQLKPNSTFSSLV